jgi:DNA-binding XRE family transcriptional regulator
MDKRYKPLTPAEQMAARQQLFRNFRERPGMPLSEALNLIRKTLRLTVSDLARISGVSTRFITDTLAGKGNPSLKTAADLLQPFGLSIGVTVKEADDSTSWQGAPGVAP